MLLADANTGVEKNKTPHKTPRQVVDGSILSPSTDRNKIAVVATFESGSKLLARYLAEVNVFAP